MFEHDLRVQITALHGSLVSLKKRVDDMYPTILQAIAEHHRQQQTALQVLEQQQKASPACQTEQVLLQMTPRATDLERSGPANGDGKYEAVPAEPKPAAAATNYDDAGLRQNQEPTAPTQVGGLISHYRACIVSMMLQDTNFQTNDARLLAGNARCKCNSASSSRCNEPGRRAGESRGSSGTAESRG